MTTQTHPYQAAIVVGRMQMYHKGHGTLMRTALEQAEKVVVVLGSAFRSRDTRNPFNWEERVKMISATLSAQELARVTFVPVRDYFDNKRWNEAVLKGTSEPLKGLNNVVLVGFKKDHTSYYLANFPEWKPQMVQQEFDIDATALRKVFFEAGEMDSALAVLEPFMHPKVLAYLQAWSRLPVFAKMQKEHTAVVSYRKKYTADFYVTADAVVRVGDHVLLIKRGGDIGNGLWALPGGFVEKHEYTEAAAMRELREETRFGLLEMSLLNARQGSAVFQDPARSARARIMTHAYYYRFGDMPLPEVMGSDDAKEARWVPIKDLPAYEDKLFEDHAVILDSFIGMFD